VETATYVVKVFVPPSQFVALGVMDMGMFQSMLGYDGGRKLAMRSTELIMVNGSSFVT